jgi:hypothetical protein
MQGRPMKLDPNATVRQMAVAYAPGIKSEPRLLSTRKRMHALVRNGQLPTTHDLPANMLKMICLPSWCKVLQHGLSPREVQGTNKKDKAENAEANVKECQLQHFLSGWKSGAEICHHAQTFCPEAGVGPANKKCDDVLDVLTNTYKPIKWR